MKHIKIISALTFVVVLFSLLVYGANEATADRIEAIKLEKANAAKFIVLPELDADADKEAINHYFTSECPEELPEGVTCDDTTYDFTGSTVSKLFVVPGKGYIYEAKFQGFASIITYMIGINEDGALTGFFVVEQNDSQGYGANIVNDDVAAQFPGLTLDQAEAGEFDGVVGATATTSGLKASMENVVLFHKVTFQGVVVETPEEKLLRLKREITVSNATFTDVSSQYTLPSGITKVEMANDGTTDIAVVITVVHEGIANDFDIAPNGDNTYVVSFDVTTGNINGIRVVEALDNPGYGAKMEDDTFFPQFTGITQDTAKSMDIDGLAGATLTRGDFKNSLSNVIDFYQAEFEGVAIETPEERLERYYDELTSETATFTDVTADYTLQSGVTKIELANNGTEDFAVVYTVAFQGYVAADTVYLVAFDLTTGNLTGVRVVEAGDSVGIGSKIAEEAFFPQFDDMTQTDAQAGGFDEQAGASYPVTLSAFEASLDDVVDFHKAAFEGAVIETPEEKLARWYEELSAVGATFTDVTSQHTLASGIQKIEVANNGTTDIAVIFTVVHEGIDNDLSFAPNGDNTYIVSFSLETGNIIGLRVLESLDNLGYGAKMADETFFPQFDNITQETAQSITVDGLAGATLTRADFEISLSAVVDFYKAAYEGATVETPEERLERYYDELTSETATFTDVTGDYTLQAGVTKIELANNGTEDFAVIYTVAFQGYVAEDTVYLVAFDLATGNITGVRVVEAADSAGIGSKIGEEEFFPQFDNITQTDAQAGGFDEQAGASYPITLGKFETSLAGVVDFHNVSVGAPERPTPIPLSLAQLQAAFGNTITDGTAIYELNPFVEGIDNVYAVYEGANLVGYVYLGYYEGREPTVESLNFNIYFSVGIGLDGLTKNVNVIIENESWQDAPTYTDPEKSLWGDDFTTTTWHDQFENQSLLGLISSPVDGIAGVTITTGGFIDAFDTIIYYHINEILGGGN